MTDHPVTEHGHAAFPLKIEWEKTLPVLTAEPFPPPVRSSREGTEWGSDFACPSPVLALAEFAREALWEVRTQYSQGHFPHGTTGRPGVLKDAIGLRFGAHPMTERQAYAVYSKTAGTGAWAWTWRSVMIWGPDLPPYGGLGIAELKDYLAEPDTETLPMLAWVDMIKRDREKQEAARKARPKSASKPKEGLS